MKTFFVMVYYDEGGVDEYEMEALSMDDAENIVYAELGRDVGEVCITETFYEDEVWKQSLRWRVKLAYETAPVTAQGAALNAFPPLSVLMSVLFWL